MNRGEELQMASSLVRGKHVICKITGRDSAEVVPDGAVFQKDGEILEIGRYEDLRARHPETEVIGSTKHVVMPGIVNDHFHVGVSPFQMGSPDLPLELWGLHRLGARSLDPYLDQLYGAVQMIESGTTTVQALHATRRRGTTPLDLEVTDKAIKAYMDSGMRVSYAPSTANQHALVVGPEGDELEFAKQLPGDLRERFTSFMAGGYRTVEELMPVVEDICRKYGVNNYERVRVTLAPSNVHRCSDELLMAFKDMAAKYNTGIHIHLQETIYQKMYGLRAWNKTPLQHLQELGFLGPEVVCGHSLWVTEDDIAALAATGTTVCHNASSNLRLQSGIAPLGPLVESGIRVALGSDEATINDDKDMLQEMRLVLKLHRVPGVEHVAPTAHQVFQMATENGAHASWFGDRVGTLEIGKRADLILLNLQNIEEPYLDPDVSIVDAVVHRGRGIDVDTVMVDGEIVMQDRRLTKVDKEGLFRELKSALDRPLDPAEQERRDLGTQLIPHVQQFLEGTLPSDVKPHAIYNARL